MVLYHRFLKVSKGQIPTLWHRMDPQVKPIVRIATLAGLAFIAFHFACTLIYSIPSLQVPDTAKAISQKYMYPYFHQGWKLFAPDVPEDQYLLEYRYPTTEGWSNYIQGETPAERSHPRIGYIAQKLQVYLARDMKKNLYAEDSAGVQYDHIVEDAAYLRVLYYAVRMHEIRYQQRPDSIQLRMTVQRTRPLGEEGGYLERAYEFPVFHFND